MELEGNIIDLRQKIFFEILEDFLSQEIKTRFLAKYSYSRSRITGDLRTGCRDISNIGFWQKDLQK